MRIPALRLPGVVAGNEIFRVASLCLYITLLLHAVLASYVLDLRLSDLSIIAVSLLALLFFVALARYVWPEAVCYGRGRLLLELCTAVFVVLSLALQQATPTLPLPWLIGLAGIFPLAQERMLALATTLALALIGVALNITLDIQMVDWLPQLFATTFTGLSAVFLSEALRNNLAAVQLARTNERRFDAIARKRQEEHALLRAVLDLNPSMIYATDAEGRFTISNLCFQRHFGYSSEEALSGKTIHDVFLQQAAKGQESMAYAMAERLHQLDMQVIRTGLPLEDQEMQGLWDSEQRAWHRVNKFPLRDAAGDTAGMLCIARDITDRKEYEMRLQHQALHDPLTGLPNRRYLLKTIADSIAQTDEASRQLAMLFCDLDFFKSVNDTHGHDFGDKCLMEITRRIQAELPTQDFVARFGGNEFVVLSNASVEEAKTKADALLQAVSQQLVVDDAVVKIQASIGIALLDPEHKNPSELIRAADAAMFQAKERGRNRAEIFDASLQSNTTKRAQMDVALRFALERAELDLVYQPKVSILNGAVKGFELLLRWNNPQYGVIPPVEFIPVAENSGLVVPIGLWVLEQACRQLRTWHDAYPDEQGFTVAVNVSMRQLLQPDFLDEVTAILDRTGVPPHAIELELTETSAMANPVQTIETLARLKRLGLRLALDDFGTGYSSLAYLQKLPIDVLKIDKAFVQGLGKNPGDAEIVRLILALAQTLNLETVAEGVETRDDMMYLKKMGCYVAQGFAFSPPISADAAGELIRSARHFPVA